MKLVKILIFFGAIGWLLSNSVPRLMTDLWHARDFVPAQSYMVTKYECTNWNLFMFNDCTVTFISLQSGESRQIMDVRFGPAPRDPVRLLQRRDDASSVTTDVSLRTVWNRLSIVVMFVLFGAFGAIVLIARAFKNEATPIPAPSEELAPTRRAAFGKRPA